MKAKLCFISLPLPCEKWLDEVSILSDMRAVSTKNNEILDAIMRVYDEWDQNPVIWVRNSPYKIKIVSRRFNEVLLYQMNIRYDKSTTYKIISKRMVRIIFE